MGIFEKAKDGFWPTIVNQETAQKASRSGFWAAVFIAVVSGGAGALAYANINILNLSSLAMIDGLIFAVIAFGIYKNSRVASVAGLFMYIVQRIDMWSQYGPKNPAMALIFILFFVNSIRGTFAYRKYSKSSGGFRVQP